MAKDTNAIYNNFSSGMVSERMRRRADLGFYMNSARLMRNLLPLQTGGFVLRHGTKTQDSIVLQTGSDGNQKPTVVPFPADAVRIVPFISNVDNYYVVVLSPNSLKVYAPFTEEDTWEEQAVTLKKFGVSQPTMEAIFDYTYISEIQDIQYTQDSTHLILCHRNHRPVVLVLEKGAFTLSPLELETKTSKVKKDEKGNEEYEAFLYDGLFTEKDKYPATCAYCANRLWFGSTNGKPFGLWASRPFEYNNFQDYEWYSYVDDETTVEQYLNAIKGSGSEKIENEDGSYVIVTITTLEDGRIKESRQKYTKEGQEDGPAEIKYINASTPVTKWEKTITADCSMFFETGSDRDERIEWINAYDNIIIGTASSEWMIPWNINALEPSIRKIGAYGACKNRNCVAGGTGVFYPQSGGKRVRGFLSSNEGFSFMDMNYLCPDILKAGIKELHWQRVPYQRLYVVLNDGSLAVLCYEPDYGINAWVEWKFDVKLLSLAIVDDTEGQSVYALFDTGNGRSLERFDDTVYCDHVNRNPEIKPVDFIGELETNGIDDLNTLATAKNAFTIYVDSQGTNFKAGVVGSAIRGHRSSVHHDLELVDTFSPNTYDELKIRIESYPAEPLTVLAIKAEIGLGR